MFSLFICFDIKLISKKLYSFNILFYCTYTFNLATHFITWSNITYIYIYMTESTFWKNVGFIEECNLLYLYCLLRFIEVFLEQWITWALVFHMHESSISRFSYFLHFFFYLFHWDIHIIRNCFDDVSCFCHGEWFLVDGEWYLVDSNSTTGVDSPRIHIHDSDALHLNDFIWLGMVPVNKHWQAELPKHQPVQVASYPIVFMGMVWTSSNNYAN